jgi:predicted ATP-grasp superfamily ATP-dependent carboligase
MKTNRWRSQGLPKAYKVTDVGELMELYDRVGHFSKTFILQEWIEGVDSDLYSCNCYYSRTNDPLVTFVAKKVRQWPPHTGTSSLGLEVRDDNVLETTLDLFRGIGYRGLGYVEMKRDRRNGRYYIIEPNIGRPTGRSAIAEAGDVALLYTMYCDVLERPLPENRQQQYRQARWIYWRHDFQSAFYYWRRGELTLGSWLRSWIGPKACAVFSWRDPAPFVADLSHSLAVLFGSGKKDVETSQLAPSVSNEPT